MGYEPPVRATTFFGKVMSVGGSRLGTHRRFLVVVQQTGGSRLGQKSSQQKALTGSGHGNGFGQ
ncbi:MAG: hypothetical protein QGF59_32500 [Pirellulaceae bacterium]|nr:hypothetical protein [Pirellulaceae bacterium]